jgi:hypothetical protein
MISLFIFRFKNWTSPVQYIVAGSLQQILKIISVLKLKVTVNVTSNKKVKNFTDFLKPLE